MKKILITLQTILLLFFLTAGHAAWAESDNDPYFGEEAQYSEALFSMSELEDLVAPIALYPDPLIAQILPAATFVDQIDEAARYVSQYGRYARIDSQYWDVSVKAVAHYPDVLNMMDQKYDWTISLGQAFINQPDDVMYAIQLLRQDARAAGNLYSTPQQQVIIDNGYIRIIPAQPEVIYVPVYDPQVVYVERPSPSYGFITFGAGLSIGVWLNRDCDWRDRRVYYHGWRGRDWVNRARPHVHTQNNIYVNQTNTVININQQVMRHDTERYRERIRQNVQIRRERHEVPPSMRQDHRPREKAPRPGRGPVPGAPRPDQRIPGNYRIVGEKPIPAVTPRQPRTPSGDHERQPRGRGDQRGERREQLPGGQPQPRVPAGAPRPDQRIPGNYRTPGGKPTPAVTPQQPRSPSSDHERQPREKGDLRGERRERLPSGQPQPSVPAAAPRPDQRIPGNYRTPGGRPTPAVTPQQPRTPSPSGQPRQGVPTSTPRPDQRIPENYRTPGARPAPVVTPQQPRPGSERGEKQSPSVTPSRPATQPAPRDIYRERGRSSQENIRQQAHPAPVQQKPAISQQAQPGRAAPGQHQPMQRPAPAQRPQVEHRSVPAPRQVSPPALAPRPAPPPTAAPQPAPAPPQQKAPAPRRDDREQK